MGDIQVGDEVISVDGTPTKVLGVYPQGQKGIYRVTFDDGASTECCDEHLWLTQTLYERRKASQNPEWDCAKPKVRELSEIRATLDKQHFIPVVEPVQLQGDISQNLIPAYTLGVILGDGDLSAGSLRFANPDEEVASRVAAELPASMVMVKQESADRCVSYRLTNAENGTEADGTFSKGAVRTELERIGLRGTDSFGKFIPREYLSAKIADRVALLQGLMDTDGTADERTNSAYFTTVSPSLKDGFVELVQSLGGIARVSEKVPTYTYRGERRTGQKAYTVNVVLPEGIDPFSLPRKADKLKARTWGKVRRKIVSVDCVGEKAAQCIAVEHESHLYVTDNYIVTHNTATGLGIAKRFYNDGKRNTAVVVPSDKVAHDWVQFAGLFDMPLKKLESTQDNGGSGPIITTYANFGQNPTLAERDWDLIIADESHYLSSSESGSPTAALRMLRALSGHHDGFHTWMESRHREQYEAMRAAEQSRADANGNLDISETEYARREREAQRLNKEWRELLERERPGWEARWVEQRDLPRVTFLSATPFAYVKSLEYAEGYLFNFVPPAEQYRQDRHRGYNEADAREQFYIENFGYRMRHKKLTQPESGVDAALMEQQFNERMKQEGAISGRRLEVPFDYERRFLLVEDAVGTKIDEGLAWLREADGGRFMPLYDAVMEKFDYHQRMYLLESIKAKHAVPHIKKNLALGRKVVVFYDFNKGGGFHPFALPSRPGVEISYSANGKHRTEKWDKLVQAFRNQRPDLVNLNMKDLHSPIATMQQAFPNALFVNGRVSESDRIKNADLFNDDDSGHNLIVLQSDAGREGISLHDTTGKHPRALINLGMPTRPVANIQIEGRTYRTGQASNAIFDYMTTGTAWEAHAFGTKIAERSSTAENLALGVEARGLRQAFIDAYQNAEYFEPGSSDGTGGKEYDRTLGASSQLSGFDRAKSYYYGQQKNTKRRDQREGVDYFATPEPVGFKMVEWAGIKAGDSVLEPSAGHGAIARFVPGEARLTMVEPSYQLSQRAALARGDARIVNDNFESLAITNKYDAIVMNPPYGSGGKTSTEHVAKAARHLRNGGRIVALLPRGGMADQRWNAFMKSEGAANLHTVATIDMPAVTFERAGTKVNTRLVVLERQDNPDDAANLEQRTLDLTSAETVNELFDRIEHIELPERVQPTTADGEPAPSEAPALVEHVTRKGKTLRGIIRTDLTKEQAQEIDRYTFHKKSEAGETGWFIREKHIDDMKYSVADPRSNPAFAQWFGDSKVVDGAGRPLVVYHGTQASFNTFQTGKNKAADETGIFFSPDPEIASLYTGYDELFPSETIGNVMPVYLRIENPKVVDFKGGKYGRGEAITQALADGHDGVLLRNHYDAGGVQDQWVAFRPEQIKSATGNTGSFDPANPDIRYSINAELDLIRSIDPSMNRNAVQRQMDRLQHWAQDRFADLDRLQRNIGVTDESADAYLTEELFHGRARKRLDVFDERFTQPILKAIKESGLTMEQVEEWLHARHAQEANAVLAERNPSEEQIQERLRAAQQETTRLENDLRRSQRQGSATKAIEQALTQAKSELDKWTRAQPYRGTEAERLSLSGMSDDAAADILARREGNKALEEVGRLVDQMNDSRLNILGYEELMTPEEIRAIRSSYQHYVPLKREEVQPQFIPRGQGFNVKGREVKRRVGSQRRVDNILPNLVAQYQATVIRAEKARVHRALYRLARNNPDPNFWRIDRAPKERTLGRDGLVTQSGDPRYKERDNVLTVKIRGEEYTIEFNPANETAMRIASSMKNLEQRNMGLLLQSMAQINRLLSAINTGWNPEFVISNAARDIQTAVYNIGDTEANKIAGRMLRDYPKALAGIRNAIRGDGSTEWAKHFDEFEREGGRTGWMEHMDSIEDKRKRLVRDFNMLGNSKFAVSRRQINRLASLVRDYNDVVENVVRLSAYVNAKRAGLSPARAASLAKNLTVNFNRKGAAGPAMDAMYLFYNASVQGSVRLIQAMTWSRRTQQIVAATVVTAAVIDMAMRALSDEDDDGVPYYDKIPDYVGMVRVVPPFAARALPSVGTAEKIWRPLGDYSQR